MRLYEIEIEKFDLQKMVQNPVIFCIGNRRSGKSWLIRELLYVLNNRYTSLLYLYSPTDYLNGFYEKFVQKKSKKSHIDIKDDFVNILEKQKDNIRKDVVKKSAFVSDDMTDYLLTNKSFKDMLFLGRHYNISCIMSLDYAFSIQQIVIENTDYIFLFREDSYNLKKYWNIISNVIDFKTFQKIFIEYTSDYSCLVIDKRSMSISSTYNDILFHYKANDPGEFLFGDQYAANIIQEKFLDWFYKPECKDGTLGINCKLAKSMCKDP